MEIAAKNFDELFFYFVRPSIWHCPILKIFVWSYSKVEIISMKKIFVLIFGISICSSVVRFQRELNENCPDLELWDQCSAACGETLIECIQNCEDTSELNCASECNRNNIVCESGNFYWCRNNRRNMRDNKLLYYIILYYILSMSVQ